MAATPARADAVIAERTYHGRPVYRYRAAHRPRRIVREVIAERPIHVRRRVVVRRYGVPDGYGPPPYVFGAPPFPPRFAYGPGLYGPVRPVGFG